MPSVAEAPPTPATSPPSVPPLSIAGFDPSHRTLFLDWLSSRTFKSVITREKYEARVQVLQLLQRGLHARQLADQELKTMVFIQKTRQFYSLGPDGALYYHGRKAKGTLLVIPHDDVFDTIVHEHCAIQHQGTNKTWYEVSRRYHGIPKSAVDWVLQRCMLCHLHCAGPRPAPWQPIVSHHVMERVQMDLIDMREQPDGKYRWILHIKDHYSRFCMLYPLRRRRGAVVVRHLMEWIAVLGPPQILQTDNGIEFVNDTIQHVAMEHGILIRHGQTGRPRSQGLVERANGHVRRMIAKWCRRRGHRSWSKALASIALACNMSMHATIRKSPFEVVFGRRPPQRLAPCSPSPGGPRSYSEEPDPDEHAETVPSVLPFDHPSKDDVPTSAGPVRPQLVQNSYPVLRRRTPVSIAVQGLSRAPLDDYRIPGLVAGHKTGAGYRICTAWGLVDQRVPARHVLPLPEGFPVPQAAQEHLDHQDTAPRVSLAVCAQQHQLTTMWHNDRDASWHGPSASPGAFP